MKKITLLLLSICILVFTAAGCTKSSPADTTSDSEASATTQTYTQDTSETGVTVLPDETYDSQSMFSDRDKEIGYSESDSTHITLSGNTATVSGGGAEASGSTVTIKSEGTFIFTGTLTNGQIAVNAAKDEKVQIVLNSVTITNSSSAPLYIKQADKVFITLASGSKNVLKVSGNYVNIDDNNIDAAIFSKEDVTINGEGSLTVNATYGHGIVSKDDIAITGGTIAVTAASHGISGKNSVRIADGTISISSGKDGIHSENSDDTSLGYVYIAGGKFTIKSDGDGISAAATVQIDAGTFTITSGSGSANAKAAEKEGFGGMWQPSQQSTEEALDSVSSKGIKAAGNFIIESGTFNIDSCDDAIHSNTSVYINSGTLNISTGDDGIHADAKAVITGGTITIAKSYEGIEGQSIDITGGTIKLTASDDGFNAAGGTDSSANGGWRGDDAFSSDANAYIKISGGSININALGDGIDSNGSLTVSGGKTYVSGPTNGGNGALDYGSDATITGGIFVACGSTQMAQNFGDASTQGSVLYGFESEVSAGTAIILKDSSGKTIVSFTPENQYQCAVISAPGIKTGSTYTVSAGNATGSVEMTDIVWSNVTSSMGGGGFAGGSMPGDFPGGKGNRGEMPTKPA